MDKKDQLRQLMKKTAQERQQKLSSPLLRYLAKK
jgi:hypothetical protein